MTTDDRPEAEQRWGVWCVPIHPQTKRWPEHWWGQFWSTKDRVPLGDPREYDEAGARAEALARVDKLAEILDEGTPCTEDCPFMAIVSWVDPRDKERVHGMRDMLREKLSAAEAENGEMLRVLKRTRVFVVKCANMPRSGELVHTVLREIDAALSRQGKTEDGNG